MKTYLRIVIAIIVFVTVYGIIVPYLVSLSITLSVMTGLALAFLTPPFLFMLIKSILNNGVKK